MKFFLYTCIILTCCTLFSCRKKELMSFQSGDKVYIYKDTRTINNDSLIYSFAVRPDALQFDTIRIPIRIMGIAKPTDRKVNYEVVSASSDVNPVNYELLPSIIPAGSFSGVLPIRLVRTADLKTKQYTMVIRIKSSEDFTPGVDNQTSYLIRLNDYLSKPVSWKDSYFGTYSNTKFDLLIKTTGYISFDGLGESELRWIARATKNAVFEWETEHGTTMLDENGVPVVVP